MPFFAPLYRRAQVAEAVCRANYQMAIGCWELDMSDGETRFRSSLPICGADVTDAALDAFLFSAWGIAAKYANALLEVAVSEADPEVAIARAEASLDEADRNTTMA